MQMCQVVNGPGCQQLRQSYYAESGMQSAPREIFGPEVQRAQLVQAFGPQTREFIQQLRERFALALAFLRVAIEWLKRLALAELKDSFCARHPVGPLAV